MKIEITKETAEAILKLRPRLTTEMCLEMAGNEEDGFKLSSALVELIVKVTSKSK